MQQSNFLWDVEPIEEDLVSAPKAETLTAELAEPQDDELMVEARKLDDEPNDTEETEVVPPDEEDPLTVEARKLDNEEVGELVEPKDNAAVACLSTCAHRHVHADQEPCLSCDVTSLSNYRAETDKQADDEDDGSWSSDEPDDP